MIWVEIRQLAFVAICAFAAIEAAVILAVTHAGGTQVVATFAVLTLLGLALLAAFQRQDRGRRARYAPVLINRLGITSGVAYGLWQAYDLCRSLHSTREVTALLTGLAIALVAIGAVVTQRQRRTSER